MTHKLPSCGLVLFAERFDSTFYLGGAFCWVMFVLPGIICGVLGIMEAFRGNRKGALMRGGFATVLPLALLAGLVIDRFSTPSFLASLDLPVIFWMIVVPLAPAFWA